MYQFNAPLYFANVGVFLSRLYLNCGLNPVRFEQQEKGCFQQCYDKVSGTYSINFICLFTS